MPPPEKWGGLSVIMDRSAPAFYDGFSLPAGRYERGIPVLLSVLGGRQTCGCRKNAAEIINMDANMDLWMLYL